MEAFLAATTLRTIYCVTFIPILFQIYMNIKSFGKFLKKIITLLQNSQINFLGPYLFYNFKCFMGMKLYSV